MNGSTHAGGALIHDPRVAALWEKLRHLSFDSGTGPRTFAARLASEQGWSTEFTAQAVEEYRRFLLLFALEQGRLQESQPAFSGQPAVRIVPSAVVDKVWHLHLLYTRSYWETLCRDLLGGPLHHLPADGTGGEVALLEKIYRHTIDAYGRTFGQLPPESIWPAPESKLPPLAAATPPPTERSPEPVPARSTVRWLLFSCPFGVLVGLLLARRVTAENFALFVGAGCVVTAAMVLVVSCGLGTESGSSVRRRSRRRAIYFGGNGDTGGCWAGGSDSGDGCANTHHAGGHCGGAHDVGGHSHSCGGHGCGGHGCGGHGCGGHGCGGH